jgi:predicted polyphosphate/ATP-dependent NAD kinase
MNTYGKRIGIVVNPIAGIGGRVGLKGSDGQEILQKALSLGEQLVAPNRTLEALRELAVLNPQVQLICYPHEMGQDEALQAGFLPRVVGHITKGATTAEDTKRAVKELSAEGIDLLLFTGGDGTARDILDVLEGDLPVLGIPSGVKTYSSVFAESPRAASKLIKMYLQEELPTQLGEVLDIDEEAYRKGELSVKIYGYLLTISEPVLIQESKSVTILSENEFSNQIAIAKRVVEDMVDGDLYILGPGTTTKAIADYLGLEKTTLGVDLIENRKIVIKDANESQIISAVKGKRAWIIVSLIGRQGYIFGRGNQQISPSVIRLVGRDHIIVIATRRKQVNIERLRVDTYDFEVDQMLQGFYKVIVDYNESVVMRCTM